MTACPMDALTTDELRDAIECVRLMDDGPTRRMEAHEVEALSDALDKLLEVVRTVLDARHDRGG
jgi:hypothetical protein